MKKFAIINGPNLNLLGQREVDVYGSLTLQQIKTHTEEKLVGKQVELDWFQSNVEGEIINQIHKVIAGKYDALIINPGGYSHTSVAIFDALKIVKIPVIEVHLTNVHSREDFRQTMLTARAASIIMGGLGKDTYYMAVYSQLEHTQKG